MNGVARASDYRVVCVAEPRALGARRVGRGARRGAGSERRARDLEHDRGRHCARRQRRPFDGRPPRSFPAKLTRFLFERARTFDFDASRGVVVLPCELIEDNGATLAAVVAPLASRWALDRAFRSVGSNRSATFCNTLVDRIVPRHAVARRRGATRATAWLSRRLDDRVRAVRVCSRSKATRRCARGSASPAPTRASSSRRDIRPYRERKVRVLNGAHTLVVPVALLAGLRDGARCRATDDRVGQFLRRA